MGASCTPVVLVEEVAGLTSHPHFGRVLEAWTSQGYRLAWRRSLQLSEICPTSTLRLFLVFVHSRTCPRAAEQAVDCVWRSQNFPSMESCHAIFRQMPQELLQPCLLPPELRSIYLDERFFPPSRNSSVGPRPISTRVRTAADQAVCFLASYHTQHELPQDLLAAKGILCSILQDQGEVRFYAAPEIACAHGANLVHFMPSDDKDCMRWLGNSLAVLQSAFVAALAMQYFEPQIVAPDPREVVSRVLAERMDCLNSVFLKVDGGWLLARRSHLATLLARRPIKQQVFHAQGSFVTLRRECAFETDPGIGHSLVVLGHATVDQVPDLLDTATAQAAFGSSHSEVSVLDFPVNCNLCLAGHSVRQTSTRDVLTLLAPRYTFCVM